MEKLVEYYNEYQKKRNLKEYYEWLSDVEIPGQMDSLTFLKDFCKWLVDNDKIDRSKVLISFSMAEYDGLGNMYGHGVDDNQRLLMILAISDNPIEDLVSILR